MSSPEEKERQEMLFERMLQIQNLIKEYVTSVNTNLGTIVDSGRTFYQNFELLVNIQMKSLLAITSADSTNKKSRVNNNTEDRAQLLYKHLVKKWTYLSQLKRDQL